MDINLCISRGIFDLLNKIDLKSLIYILLEAEKAKQPTHTSHTADPVNLADFLCPTFPRINVHLQHFSEIFCFSCTRRFEIIEIDTLEYQQTEKIETELKDVDRIHRIRKVYAS